MKVLHIGKYFSPFSGGLENYMRDAMVALQRHGVMSIALVHNHALSLRTRDETFRADGQDFPVTRTGMWARLMYAPISPAFPWRLRKLISKFEPDILHLHMPNPSTFWALFLPSARRIPWVVHWHSDVITTAHDWRLKLFYTFYRPFESALLKRASSIIATSPSYKDTSEPLKPWLSKCDVVPLGVDADRFGLPGETSRNETAMSSMLDKETEKQKSPRGTFRTPTVAHSRPLLRVLAVGRLTYYKGFRYLLKAASQTPSVHINLVGQGDQASSLKALTASLNLSDRVTFHGCLSNTELAQQMADCDCLCLPSIERTEAFGMVLLEAMYYGKPTVISDVAGSGMGWIVDHEVTGLKVKASDADAIAEALERLALNRDELVRLGQNGKKKFDEQFEINHAIKGLLDVYRGVANPKTKR